MIKLVFNKKFWSSDVKCPNEFTVFGWFLAFGETKTFGTILQNRMRLGQYKFESDNNLVDVCFSSGERVNWLAGSFDMQSSIVLFHYFACQFRHRQRPHKHLTYTYSYEIIKTGQYLYVRFVRTFRVNVQQYRLQQRFEQILGFDNGDSIGKKLCLCIKIKQAY